MPPPSDKPILNPSQEFTFRGLTSGVMTGINKKFIGAVKDEWQLFSDRASDYTIGEPIGHGASSIVYAAMFNPQSSDPHNPSTPIPCALKVLDLDSLPPRSLKLLQRETTLMSLSKHPNVLRVRGSWMDGHNLYIAMRLMNKGSAADVMRYGWPGGLEEDVVRCILRQALKGLNYLHVNGFIHRDIKAANLLIDDDGTVLLGDLGVAADLSEDSSHHMSAHTHSGRTYTVTASTALSQHNQRRGVSFDGGVKARPKIGKRKSFVGTPCWMAPELIAGKQYDSSADIWSFGITALELSQGRPPRSRESPKEVLLRTIHEAPPTLDREGGTYKYSRAFKEMVDSCLAKDPSKRPTAEQLLQTPFFKNAKKKGYLINTILKDLPPLTQRQERRAVGHFQTVHTIDSWDFATTIHSPMTTIGHRRRKTEEVKPELEKPNSPFEFDDEPNSPPVSLDMQMDRNETQDRVDQTSLSSSGSEEPLTDAAEIGLSTPPTRISSIAESPPDPHFSKKLPPIPSLPDFLSSSPQSKVEEPIKPARSFWSRLGSSMRRYSISKFNPPPVIANIHDTNESTRLPGRSELPSPLPVRKESRDGSLKKSLLRRPQTSHGATPSFSSAAPVIPAEQHPSEKARASLAKRSMTALRQREPLRTPKRPSTSAGKIGGGAVEDHETRASRLKRPGSSGKFW